jgi:hypothetical protein
VSFSVLATVGLLSVASDTNKKARDEGLSARLAANEFERLRALSSASAPWTTSPPSYATRYFDSNIADLGTTKTTAAVYELNIQFSSAPTGTADQLLNAEVRYPAQALTANQNVFRFTTLMNNP